MNEMNDKLPLVEKYRPHTLDDIVGQKNLIKNIKKWRNNGQNMPHLLFYGRAGTGKTSMAKVIIKEFNADYLDINASDKRGIDTVRDRILNFARTLTLFGSPFKIIFLDEADSLTPEAQAMLRRVMEDHANNCRFIISCNNIGNIIDPIQSRCTRINFGGISEEQITNRLEQINNNEHIGLDKTDLEKIAKKCHGDMRRAINDLQVYEKPKNEFEELFT